MTTQSKSAKIAKFIGENKYSFPGGYEMFAVMSDAASVCFDCCKSEYRSIATTTGTDGWTAVGIMTTDQIDEIENCAHCGRQISGGSENTEPNDNIVVYTLPESFAGPIVNDDYSALTDRESEIVNNVLSELPDNCYLVLWDSDPEFITYHDAQYYGWGADNCYRFMMIED